MPRKKSADKTRKRRTTPSPQEELQGPPPREALMELSEAERRAIEQAEGTRAANPRLTGGDVDADWQRAHLTGEEAVGGSAVTPDQDVVDQRGDALGVPRGLNEEVRSSAEILEERDERRHRAGE